MIDFIRKVKAFLRGRELVWLSDHDGEVSLRYARRTPFGLSCKRWSNGTRYDCLLLPDGSVRGPAYVVAWLPYSQQQRANESGESDAK